MKWMRGLGVGSLNALMAACASAPAHYHTLVPAPPDAAVAPPPSSYEVEVESVKIPPQVDRFEWVVRRSNGEIALVENELWIAPLADDLRNAVSIEIDRQLRSTDAAGARNPPSISIRLDVERFESAPDRYALIEATWQLRVNHTTPRAASTCRTYAYERVGNGYAGLVRGHQRAVALIADQIASAAQRLAAGRTDVCPTT
jgi:uncharacterized lipoprotein YmbA